MMYTRPPKEIDRTLTQLAVPCLLSRESLLWEVLKREAARVTHKQKSLLLCALSGLGLELAGVEGLYRPDELRRFKAESLSPFTQEELAPFCDQQLELLKGAKTRSERLIRFLGLDSITLHLERTNPEAAAHLERRFEELELPALLGRYPLAFVSYVNAFERPYHLSERVIKAAIMRASMLELPFTFIHKGLTSLIGFDVSAKREGLTGWLLEAGRLARRSRQSSARLLSTLSSGATPHEAVARRAQRALDELRAHPSLPTPARELLLVCYQRTLDADTRRTLGLAFLELDGLLMYLEILDHPEVYLGYELTQSARSLLLTRYSSEELKAYDRRYMRPMLNPPLS